MFWYFHGVYNRKIGQKRVKVRGGPFSTKTVLSQVVQSPVIFWCFLGGYHGKIGQKWGKMRAGTFLTKTMPSQVV